jgi:hypothetical protein
MFNGFFGNLGPATGCIAVHGHAYHIALEVVVVGRSVGNHVAEEGCFAVVVLKSVEGVTQAGFLLGLGVDGNLGFHAPAESQVGGEVAECGRRFEQRVDFIHALFVGSVAENHAGLHRTTLHQGCQRSDVLGAVGAESGDGGVKSLLEACEFLVVGIESLIEFECG